MMACRYHVALPLILRHSILGAAVAGLLAMANIIRACGFAMLLLPVHWHG